jgi:hypothetical protein
MAFSVRVLITGAWILGTLAIAGPITPPPRGIAVVLNFDVEDYVSPESEGIDDIPKWLAEILSEENVTGTFFVIGEKARSLEKRGRRDVIAAMAAHDIGSHTNYGSIHPTATEILESAGGPDGTARIAAREGAGFRELERIFKAPVSIMGRHGGSYGPQLVAALGASNRGFAGSPVSLPGKSVVWYCNALNFSGQYDGFDDAYWRDDLFEPLLDKLAADLPKLGRTVEVLPFFAGHPCKIRTIQFWDLNYYAGVNRDPMDWKTPEMRPRESMPTARKNFRRLVKFLKSRHDVELVTFRDLMVRYSHQRETITARELEELARRTTEKGSFIIPDQFSAAEVFAGLVSAIGEAGETGARPSETKVRRPLGPWEMPAAKPEMQRVTRADAIALARRAGEYVEQTGSLPPVLAVKDRSIGTGSLLALFSDVYLDLSSGARAEAYEVRAFNPYPRLPNEEDVERAVRSYKTWPVHRPDLNMDKIVELTKLQFWTLKPAYPR